MIQEPLTSVERREVLRALLSLVACASAPAAFAQGALSPAQFAQLSQALTGFAYQDATASAALRALTVAFGATSLSRLAHVVAKTSSGDLDAALESAGLMAVARKVIVALYSGVVDSAHGAAVIAYNDALGWEAVPWTKPNAVCGGPTDYWASPPAGRT